MYFLIFTKLILSTLVHNIPYPCVSQTDCCPINISIGPGRYLLEVWGSQGRSIDTSVIGGKGGYSKGEIEFNSSTILYVYIGGMGDEWSTSISTKGGWNGGGSAGHWSSVGGGATDIRLVNGAWNNSISLNSRIIVAGGGGGCTGGATATSGGAGGGNVGKPGVITHYTYAEACVGTQNGYSGGAGTYITGGFGYGGSSTTYAHTGGGGGYYGGCSADHSGGGGGSGYIGSLLSANTYDGTSQFYEPNGVLSNGHAGSGHARITLMQSFSYPTSTPNNDVCHNTCSLIDIKFSLMLLFINLVVLNEIASFSLFSIHWFE